MTISPLKHGDLSSINEDQHHKKQHDLSSVKDHSGKLDEALVSYHNPPLHTHPQQSNKVVVKKSGEIAKKSHSIIEIQTEGSLSSTVTESTQYDKSTITISASMPTISFASTVMSETSYGLSPSSGTGSIAAREDHTHGTTQAEISSYRHTGRLYSSFLLAQPYTTATTTLDTLYAFPILIPEKRTAISLNIDIVVESLGASARLGIYGNSSTSNVKPSSLILDAGVVSIGSTGIKSIVISQQLSGGLYWLSFLPQATVTVLAAYAYETYAILGVDSTFTYGGTGWSAALAYGALPVSFPGASIIFSGGAVPLIFVSF